MVLSLAIPQRAWGPQLLLTLALMAPAGGSASSLDWPYSELLANSSSQVERCSTVSGFSFRNNTQLTTEQLARMCADPDCANVTSALMYSAMQSDSHVAAFTAFVVPVLNYCWYFRIPTDPCPADPVNDYLAHVADKDANCERLTGISFRETTTMTARDEAITKLTLSHAPCPSDCATLADRLSVLVDSMPCPQAPVIKDHGTISIFSAWCRGRAPLPPYGEDIETLMLGAAARYSYKQDWPIPAAKSETGTEGSTSSSSANTSSDPGSGSPAEIKSGSSNTNGTTIGDGFFNTASSSKPPAATEVVASTGASSNTIFQFASATVSCVVLLLVVWLVYKQRKRAADSYKDTDYATAGSPPARIHGGEKNPSNIDRLLPIERAVPFKHIQDQRMIGSGGHGIVYLVKDTLHDRLLASKRLIPSQVTDKTISAFLDEIKTVSTLHHPCIVTFMGATWTNRTDVQALFEYMDGGDLRTYLNTTAVTDTWTNEKLTIAMDIADALVYVHSQLPTPLVHRDLKSRNVLLTKSPVRAKLSDFGVAREVSQNETMTNGVGTSRWLAPEVILGRGDYGTACDIYSFGVVLSELDTHKIPFWDYGGAGSDTMVPEITILSMVALEGHQPTFSASCPSNILDLARQCLALNANERPSAIHVARALRKLVDGYKHHS